MSADLASYTIEEHTHRFAAWAASRAASTRTCPFTVNDGKGWIEKAELKKFACTPEKLPDPEHFDSEHQKWRQLIIEASEVTFRDKTAKTVKVTDGVAAKLINVYLKAAVVHKQCQDLPAVRSIHPPVDRLLLKELAKQRPGIWGKNLPTWSKLGPEEYEGVIQKVREILAPNTALWKIEVYWRGHQ